MPLQWNWDSFKALYTALGLQQPSETEIKQLGILDSNNPNIHSELDKGMVARAFTVAIFDYYNRDKKITNASKEKLVMDLFLFAQQNGHLEKLRRDLKRMDQEEFDDKDEKKQFKALHSGGDKEAEEFAHDVLHELHRHLEMHMPDDGTPKPKGSHS